jgi:hypothetical protein
MKSIRVATVSLIFFLLVSAEVIALRPSAGFSLPDSVEEMTLKYRMVKGLIVLPVTINDSIHVNLVLDTGCRNLILFGKKFKELFRINPGKPVVFSGLGTGKPVTGVLSLGNSVSLHQVLGTQIPVVIANTPSVFASFYQVHGVIGYDIFLRFEIELNAAEGTITFRPANKVFAPHGYTQVPLQVVDARPIIQSEVFVDRNTTRKMDLMIDTGSSLGLLLKTTNLLQYGRRQKRVLGIGFNGPLSGYQTISQALKIEDLRIERVATGIVSSEWHNNASIGMDVLKDYVVILNYCKAYACFKRNEV